jgi:hypothetical protein
MAASAWFHRLLFPASDQPRPLLLEKKTVLKRILANQEPVDARHGRKAPSPRL